MAPFESIIAIGEPTWDHAAGHGGDRFVRAVSWDDAARHGIEPSRTALFGVPSNRGSSRSGFTKRVWRPKN
jgi:hypothetical protein